MYWAVCIYRFYCQYDKSIVQSRGYIVAKIYWLDIGQENILPKICGKCKQEKPIGEFYLSKRDGHRTRCKPCHREDCIEYSKNGYHAKYNREYYSRPDIKEREKAYNREYVKRPHVKLRFFASRYVANAIKAGKLKREPCAMCGKEQVQAHHSDYSQPLMIVWLCLTCHRKIHALLRVKE